MNILFELFFTSVRLDAPIPWEIYFQDSATPQMEGLIELHDNIMYYLVIILFAVGWILLSIIRNYVSTKSFISHKYLNHGTLIELIWTITPALILILIAFPSFKLLYLMDDVNDPSMSVLVEGHQWYWSYQYPDFLDSNDEFLDFDSYIIPESDLEEGALRMLEVYNRIIIPELTHVRFIITSGDVIHSFACPALGIKCDAYLGRLNQVSVFINREGVYYSQCSEICGILHSSMPIVIESVTLEKFLTWLEIVNKSINSYKRWIDSYLFKEVIHSKLLKDINKHSLESLENITEVAYLEFKQNKLELIKNLNIKLDNNNTIISNSKVLNSLSQELEVKKLAAQKFNKIILDIDAGKESFFPPESKPLFIEYVEALNFLIEELKITIFNIILSIPLPAPTREEVDFFNSTALNTPLPTPTREEVDFLNSTPLNTPLPEPTREEENFLNSTPLNTPLPKQSRNEVDYLLEPEDFMSDAINNLEMFSNKNESM